MAKATPGGMEVEVDEDGFIQEPDKWNKEVAEDLGKIEAQYNPGEDKMGEDHWKVVNYLRDYFLQYDIAPPIRMVVKKTGIDLILSAEPMGDIHPGTVAVIGISVASGGGIACFCHPSFLGSNTISCDRIFSSYEIVAEFQPGRSCEIRPGP